MSYILDALRRADAERQRGAVPGLHDQPTTAALSGVAPDRGGLPRGAAWLALAVLALAGVLAAWLWSTTRQAPVGPAAPVPPAVAVVPAVAVPAPVSATVPATVPATVATPPPQPAPLPGAGPVTPAPLAPPQAALPAMAPVPAMPAATHPAARVPGQAREPLAPAPQRRDGAAPVDGAAPSPPPPARLPTLAELPESLRRDMPTLAAGGAMYADQPALRMVILNGQVFHEGDRPAAELLVQQIRPKSVVLQFRGQRFELPL